MSKFSKLKGKLAHRKGIHNPGALAAYIGREKLGQKEMTRRRVAAQAVHRHRHGKRARAH
jgi:hypothetical protein